MHPDFDKRVWRHAKLAKNVGFDVRLICPWDVPVGKVKDGVNLIPFQRVKGRIRRLLFIQFVILFEVIKSFRKTDLYHFHDIDILPLMTMLSFFKPVVYDIHENYHDEMLDRDWIPKLMRRPLYYLVKYSQWIMTRKIKNIVCVVPVQEQELRGKRINSVLIRNFASIDIVSKNKPDYESRKNVVIFTGGHYKSNGSELILDIIDELCVKRNRDVKFLLSSKFTSAQYKTFIYKNISKRGLNSFIEFFPQVDPEGLLHYINMAKIGISPNLNVVKQRKALPTKVFEYMASGVPSVVTDLPLIRETCSGLKFGMLVSDAPKCFANAIEDLLFENPWSANMSKLLVSNFEKTLSWESQGENLKNFYTTILNE